MTVLACIAIAFVAYGLTIAVVFRGFPAAATFGRWLLRRVLGARPKPPRHRTTSGRGLVGGAR